MMGQNRTSIDMYSSQLTANGGKISIQAGGDLNFLTANDESLNTTDISKKSSFIGIKLNSSKTTNTRNVKSELPAVLNADYIGTKSGFDTRLKGTVFNYLDGADIQAGGKISLESASEIVTNTSTKKSNSVVWQSMQDKGSIMETAKLPSFNGTVEPTFIAKGGLTVQVPVVSGKNNDVRAEVIKLSNQPGNEYLKSLIARKDVNWEAVKLAQESWDYKSQGLTGAGAAIIVIIVTVLTSGTGSAAATSVTSATGVASLGAGAKAAVATLASQASVSLINNGGDVSKTLKDLGSKESVRNLAVSVVTAGLLKEVGTALKLNPDSTYFPDRLMNNFTNAVGSTLVQTAINGGNLQDNLEKALLAGLSGVIQGELAQGIGDFLDFSNPDILEYTIHKIAHAAAGCAAAAATKASCEAGAIGAGVGEIIAGLMPDPVNGDEYSTEEKLRNRNAGKIAAGVLSAYAGYDVNTAANAADIAIENNNNTRGGPKRSLFTYLAKKAVNYIAPEKSVDPKVVANFWLRRTDRNILKDIDIDHIAQGHITTNQGNVRAVGFHHEPSGGAVARVKNVTSTPDNNGVWEGTVEIFDSASNTWVLKGGNQGKSTFFPSGWTKEQLQFELTEVFKKGQASGFVNKPQAFEAISPSGVKVRFVPPNGTTVKQWRGWPVK
ncbi:MAG: hypothetical protein GAK29_02045 [Acinetobacter bereziniae]|uniref:Uncharacterized protein n=1 Tax=Acinetobacter bereziniae TaxID=106648 RepID=A0A833PFP8_ACIBZ|nr:MAG: hypothetical protein GAK29_02045 [Acinetobacter bereziniae]